jgi:hypothetical protein
MATAQSGGFADLPVTPDPAECRVEPRTVETINAAIAAATPATPAADAAASGAIAIPVGQPVADAETWDGVVGTLREIFACFNAGAPLRAFALFSDRQVAGFFGPEPITAADVEEITVGAEPRAPEMRLRLVAVTNLMRYDDGRVGEFTVDDDPLNPPDQPALTFGFFAQEGGRWVLDGAIDFPLPV